MQTHAFLLPILLLASAVSAQTTGVVGVNDYTINNAISGSTSCNKVLLGGLPITFKITAAANSSVVLLFSLCPCSSNFFAMGTSCALTQTLDLNLTCPLFTFNSVTGAGGTMLFVVPPFVCAPPGTFLFSTQGVVFDSSCFPWPFRLTQAYDVCC